ncbi:MFS general substrate transporter [Punctularia strigosozonata HHB-11173 SS5]|uniref:MFS general substrate transporter n=1 Tax=Punctularia strigosozonata (strain HHB-11173) TaxID=741275 RepID=UPI000441655F|nr:MFS general substrate transporter [Punctularia strigosozonata HHB-11173 SS5]EIN11256.1 MFS general substrate transporter [Punctularia strigosozonata HHB-11173 SS5]
MSQTRLTDTRAPMSTSNQVPVSTNVELSPSATLCDGNCDGTTPKPNRQLSTARKYTLLILFCVAQLIDVFNNSAVISALPTIATDLRMSESESTWVVSAFQLTFASFLLVSGRISDVFNPKSAFIIGFVGLSALCIGAGFSHSKIVLIVLRALAGMIASLTIPAALALLVNVFPEPTEQARAIGIFGGSGAIGAVLGFIVGGIFVQFTTWPWIFWFLAIVSVVLAAVAYVLIPKQEPEHGAEKKSLLSSIANLDIIGVSVLTTALILLIFAVTSGTSAGWSSARVLAPLILSPFLLAAFIYYETLIPAASAAIPPATWSLLNFGVLLAGALLPYFWWYTVVTVSTGLWQSVYGWDPIVTAVHFVPMTVVAFLCSFAGPLARRIDPKWLIFGGEAFLGVATILLALASARDAYWPFVFPALVVGSAGCIFAYMNINIAIFRVTEPRMAGTIGAIFNGALQLGSAVGIAAATSVEAAVEKRSARNGGPGYQGYEGRAAAYWFLLGVIAVQMIAVLVFYRRLPAVTADTEVATGEKEGPAERV